MACGVKASSSVMTLGNKGSPFLEAQGHDLLETPIVRNKDNPLTRHREFKKGILF